MEPFDQLLKFVDLLHQYRTVERKVLIKNSDRRENDVEHSFSLAMLAWYINSTHTLHLNPDKLFHYALAHDLVEIYAGDTYFYHSDKSMSVDQKEREQRAAQRIREEFPEFPELHETIERYEARTDRESKFIYALDKVEPVLSIYMDKGRTWKKDGVTLEMLATKFSKVTENKTVEAIFKELMDRLSREHDTLFRD